MLSKLNKMSNIIAIQFLFFAINFMAGKSQELALIFNTETNRVINLNDIEYLDVRDDFALACPFQENSTLKNKFRESFFLSKNVLFVKEVYKMWDLNNEANLKICEKPFQASVVINLVTKEVEFGFELYYDKKKFEALNESPREKYAPISNLSTKHSALVRQLITTMPSFTFPKDEQRIKFNNEQMKFLWIPMFNLKYDDKYLNPKQLTYEAEVDLHFPDSSINCADYKLGEEIYEGIDMNKIYQKENFEELFKNLVKPIKLKNGVDLFFPTFDSSEPEDECVTQTNLIPNKYFYFRSTKSLSCSNLTTVPVWCYIADGLLKQLDEYIDVLAEVVAEKLQPIGGKLRIVSGTNGTLHMIKRYEDSIVKKQLSKVSTKAFSEKIIYLVNENNKIPMPTSIYKIIEYESSKCPEEQELCWYSVIIEIINKPYISREDRICKESKCHELGWDSFIEKYQDKYIACCENSLEIEKKLILPKDGEKKEFNLKEFLIPHTNENNELVDIPLNVFIDKIIASWKQEGSTSDQSYDKIIALWKQEASTSDQSYREEKIESVKLHER